MTISSRHHYLPVFYLKGFTKADGFLEVYDLKENRLIKPQSPKSIFFEKDRNTLFLESGKTDFIEQFYSMIDTKCAPTFEKLRSSGRADLSTDILLGVKFFINVLFWHLPVFR